MNLPKAAISFVIFAVLIVGAVQSGIIAFHAPKEDQLFHWLLSGGAALAAWWWAEIFKFWRSQ